MNWGSFLSNLAGTALVGGAAAAKMLPAGTPLDWKVIAAGAAVAAAANVTGLFQKQPHKDGQ